MENQLYSICYTSSVETSESKADIESLLDYSSKRNMSIGISGILLYNNGNFMQVLEGTENQIVELFSKIKKDTRHKNVQLIYSGETSFSVFKGYKSAFSNIMKTSEFREFKEYIELLEEVNLETQLTPTLKVFINSAFRF